MPRHATNTDKIFTSQVCNSKSRPKTNMVSHPLTKGRRHATKMSAKSQLID